MADTTLERLQTHLADRYAFERELGRFEEAMTRAQQGAEVARAVLAELRTAGGHNS